MNAKSPSLRGSFLRFVALPLIISGVLIWLAGLACIYHEVDEVYDATLVQFAKEIEQLTQQVTMGVAESDAIGAGKALAHTYERNIAYRVTKGGNVIAHSVYKAGTDAISTKTGFFDKEILGERWRFFVYAGVSSGTTVEVAEKYIIRNEMIHELLTSLLLPALLFLVSILVIVWWGASKCLHRLVQLSGEVDARDANDLTPIVNASIPREVQPLLTALNRLFARVTESYRREREFTDNAAHELRTPLAAIKTQAQVIERSEKLSKAGQDGFANLLGAIDRATNMVGGLLDFTRLQAEKAEFQDIDFSRLVQQELDDLREVSQWKGRRIDADIQEGVMLRGAAQGLSILVRNVVNNALKFAPEGGTVSVSLKSGDTISLVVEDAGPGIPDDLKERVFDRFFKGANAGAAGSGLGLSMVKWVADLHGAKIFLTDRMPHGLQFTVTFPGYVLR